jgi:hypothetical protein
MWRFMPAYERRWEAIVAIGLLGSVLSLPLVLVGWRLYPAVVVAIAALCLTSFVAHAASARRYWRASLRPPPTEPPVSGSTTRR